MTNEVLAASALVSAMVVGPTVLEWMEWLPAIAKARVRIRRHLHAKTRQETRCEQTD